MEVYEGIKTRMKKSTKIKYRTLAILFGICFIASAILSFIPIEQACGGVQTSCYEVQESGYKETLGVKNSYFGLIAFSILGVLSLTHLKFPKKRTKKFITLGIIAGTLFALYFIYLQFFVIHATCKYCMVADVGTLLSLGIIFFWKE